MTVPVPLPELGESVEGGTLIGWLVAVGDHVTEGQAVAEVSTDKVDTEVPAPRSGTVIRLVADVGAEVAVGAVLLELEPADADAPADAGSAAPAAATAAPADATPPAAAAPAAAPAPAAPAAAPTAPAATTVLDPAARRRRLSPLVRRLLREHGLDPAALTGTGTDGRLTADDVRAAAGRRTPANGTRPAAVAPAATWDGASRTEPLSRTRTVIARRMHDSLRTTAQLTSAVEADVSRIMALRARVRDAARARHGVSLSPLAFLAHATARTLAAHPLLNASIDVDAGERTLHGGVNLGIAVDAPTGLIVPVIRDAHTLGPVTLQLRIADLAERARTRRIGPDDLTGGTFTITNTGSRGSLFDTPILNPPEVGILATPAIEKRPVVVTAEDGTDRIAVRHRTYLCLTYDHRLVDGADAARFLTDLAAAVDRDDWGPEVDALLG